MEDEVRRFTKNGDQELKPGYFFQVWPMAAFANSLMLACACGMASTAKPVPYTLCRLSYKRHYLFHLFIVYEIINSCYKQMPVKSASVNKGRKE